jgi:branched-chain amino acid transport system ATP-binding protein
LSLLAVSGLCKRFGGLQAVHDVGFGVAEREILGLIGPNGAGKSTVMELVSGTQRPDAGSVLFRGQELAGRTPDAISRLGVARTFQKLRPFLGMSVIENVMVSALVHERRIPRAREIALECIEFVGLTPKREAMSSTLSTGQRKRLELARVMAKRPPLYLLDEVMAGVDQRSIGGLVELVARLRDLGGTVLIIEHNMTVIRRLCDRLVALHLGRKIAEGSPASVLAEPAVVSAYVGE